MSPHGPGFSGAGHSHNPEYPDDNWNLYSFLDIAGTTALNVTNPRNVLGIFKPHVMRLNLEPSIKSDADEEIIVIARFVSPVHIRKIMIIGGDSAEEHPRYMKCYVNHDNIDFTNIGSVNSAQDFDLPRNENGTVELITQIHPFTNVNIVTFYFPSNYGSESTSIRYIGMQGEHTHFRREAVQADYELLCTGHSLEQPGSTFGVEEHMH